MLDEIKDQSKNKVAIVTGANRNGQRIEVSGGALL